MGTPALQGHEDEEIRVPPQHHRAITGSFPTSAPNDKGSEPPATPSLLQCAGVKNGEQQMVLPLQQDLLRQHLSTAPACPAGLRMRAARGALQLCGPASGQCLRSSRQRRRAACCAQSLQPGGGRAKNERQMTFLGTNEGHP